MKKLVLGLSIVVAIGSVSCGQQKNSKYPGYEEVEKGLYIKYLKENKEGRAVQVGDVLTMNMTYATDSDSVLFDTQEIGQPVQLRADSGRYDGDVLEAFLKMREGDSASIIVSADSFFLKTAGMPQLPDYIDSASSLYFTVGLITTQTIEELQAAQNAKNAEAEAAEGVILQEYLTTNGITTEPNESGLIFIAKEEGTGKQAVAGKNVKVNYEGMLLDGTYFDTSIEEVAKANDIFNPQRPYGPLDFVLGQGQVIKGWDEGIAMMKEGGKARLIIPSKIAYGANPRPGIITPFATLIFDVELVEVGE